MQYWNYLTNEAVDSVWGMLCNWVPIKWVPPELPTENLPIENLPTENLIKDFLNLPVPVLSIVPPKPPEPEPVVIEPGMDYVLKDNLWVPSWGNYFAGGNYFADEESYDLWKAYKECIDIMNLDIMNLNLDTMNLMSLEVKPDIPWFDSQAFPSKALVSSDSTFTTFQLLNLFPSLLHVVSCPLCKDFTDSLFSAGLSDMIIHLNDVHQFSRESIAEWLERTAAEDHLDITLQPASVGN